jgi:hypothetical protein
MKLNKGDKMAWEDNFAYYNSNYLRELKKLIDEIIIKREEFFK